MKYLRKGITFQEVPMETSLFYEITGCSVRCSGCHSKELWNESNGTILTTTSLVQDLTRYRSDISCVVFLGGDWDVELINFLGIIREYGLKTCLYTGSEYVSGDLLSLLDYVKIGPYREVCGGLSSKITNQRFIEVSSGKILNSLFQI